MKDMVRTKGRIGLKRHAWVPKNAGFLHFRPIFRSIRFRPIFRSIRFRPIYQNHFPLIGVC